MSLILSAKYNVFRLQPVAQTLDIVSCFGTSVMDEDPNDPDREWKLPVSLNQFFSSLNNIRLEWTGLDAHNIQLLFQNNSEQEYVVEYALDHKSCSIEKIWLYSFDDGIKQQHSNSQPFSYYKDVPLTLNVFRCIFYEIANMFLEAQSTAQSATDKQFVDLVYDGCVC